MKKKYEQALDVLLFLHESGHGGYNMSHETVRNAVNLGEIMELEGERLDPDVKTAIIDKVVACSKDFKVKLGSCFCRAMEAYEKEVKDDV